MYNLLIPIGIGIFTYFLLDKNEKKDQSNDESNKKSTDVISGDYDRQQDSDHQEHYRERVKNAKHENNRSTGGYHISGDLDQESGSGDPKHHRLTQETVTETVTETETGTET